jgi:MFS family permease
MLVAETCRMNAPDRGVPETGPLPNRFSRGTALGCLGIACVFAFPLFLILPIQEWHLPGWIVQALALAVFAAMSAGIWMLMRVPTARRPGSPDAWHPLTRAGRAPVVEQPAGAGNRLVLVTLLVVALVAAVAYVTATTTTALSAFALSAQVVGGAGIAFVALGILVALGRLPVPAWTWARTPIHLRPRAQGIAMALLGAAALGWALLAGAGAGFGWGRVGLAVLLLCCVLATPLAQRWPRMIARNRGSSGQPADKHAPGARPSESPGPNAGDG